MAEKNILELFLSLSIEIKIHQLQDAKENNQNNNIHG